MSLNYAKNKFILLLLIITTSCINCSCSNIKNRDTQKQGVFEKLYTSNYKSDTDLATSFIILAHLALSVEQMELMRLDYEKETDDKIKFLYEFVFAKRMFDYKYRVAFIDRANKYPELLVKTDSDWISVTSPLLNFLCFCMNDDDKAVETAIKMFQLDLLDGVYATTVSYDLFDQYKIDPQRITSIANKLGIDKKSLDIMLEIP